MHHWALLSLLVPGVRVLAYPSQEPNGALQPRYGFKEAFLAAPHNLSFIDQYGGNYTLLIETPTFCESTQITAASPKNNDAMTIGQVLDNFDSLTSKQAKDIALYALKQAFLVAVEQWHSCNIPVKSELATSPLGLLGVTSPINRGNYIKEANKGFFTAQMIKGTGVFMALALNLGPIFKPSEELASTAAGVSMVLLFILAAITEWVKGQGNLDKSDAAIIKIYSEWSRAALKAIGLENDEACPSTVEASLAAAENIELQEVAVLDKYGLAKNKDIGMMRIRSCPNIVGT